MTATAGAAGIDLSGYGAAEAIGVTTINPEDAVLAARMVERCCGPDAPEILVILGLETIPEVPAPRLEPRQRAVPDGFRRATTVRRRRR